MAPIYIDFMLAVNRGVDPLLSISEGTWNSQVGQEVRQWMKDNELCTGDYKPTERLRVMIDHLCNQPLPEMKWVMPS